MTVAVDGELLRRDIHPAELAIGDTVHTGLRVFITTHRVVAYRATEDRSIAKVADLQLAEPGSVDGSRSSLMGSLEIQTTGDVVHVNRGRGCGCHSPLKGLGTPVPWA